LIVSWTKIERTVSFRPGVVQCSANLVLHRSDDLVVELPDNFGNVLAGSVKPGRVDQNGG
jgi:hypothetical protein